MQVSPASCVYQIISALWSPGFVLALLWHKTWATSDLDRMSWSLCFYCHYKGKKKKLPFERHRILVTYLELQNYLQRWTSYKVYKVLSSFKELFKSFIQHTLAQCSDCSCCLLQLMVRPCNNILPSSFWMLGQWLQRCVSPEPAEYFEIHKQWMLSVLMLLRNLQIPEPLILLHHRQTPSFISDPIQTNPITSTTQNTQYTQCTCQITWSFLLRVSRERALLPFVWEWGADKRGYITSQNGWLTPPAILRLRILHSQMAREKQRKGRWSFPLLSFHLTFASKNAGMKRCWLKTNKQRISITHLECGATQSGGFTLLLKICHLWKAEFKFWCIFFFGCVLDTMIGFCAHRVKF